MSKGTNYFCVLKLKIPRDIITFNGAVGSPTYDMNFQDQFIFLLNADVGAKKIDYWQYYEIVHIAYTKSYVISSKSKDV